MPVGSTDYATFFLGTSPDIVQIECLEIFHTDFSEVYRVHRNAGHGTITVTQVFAIFLAGDYDYTYLPMKITPLGSSTDLDQSIRIQFGDLGEILPQELDNVSAENGFSQKPLVAYRTYRSDDLTQELFGPVVMEIQNITFTKEGATFECRPPVANHARSGELYLTERFPMLEAITR